MKAWDWCWRSHLEEGQRSKYKIILWNAFLHLLITDTHLCVSICLKLPWIVCFFYFSPLTQPFYGLTKGPWVQNPCIHFLGLLLSLSLFTLLPQPQVRIEELGQVPASQALLTEETLENYAKNQECVIQHLPLSWRQTMQSFTMQNDACNVPEKHFGC